MLTLEKFEQLTAVQIPFRSVALELTGHNGEHVDTWLATLPHLNKHEQYKQIKNVLGELIVAEISDETRLSILESMPAAIERLIAQLHNDYIYDAQNQAAEQQACINEVRSLYFLLILCYQGIANRSYWSLSANMQQSPDSSGKSTKNGGFFQKIIGGLGGNVVRSGVGLDLVGGNRRLFVISVYRIMTYYYRLIMEFSLTYERTPDVVWREMNAWFLKAVTEGVDKVVMGKLLKTPVNCTIYQQYVQSCIASFTNLFAYRRQDIINIFKILPEWAKYLKTSFLPENHYRVFVNLQGELPPEIITPHASINPYSKNVVCLFIDFLDLLTHLREVESKAQDGQSTKNVFESRLAKMALLIFERSVQPAEHKEGLYQAEFLSGFGSVFKELSADKSFSQIIVQSTLPSEYHPKKLAATNMSSPKEVVKMITKNNAGSRFVYGEFAEESENSAVQTRPFLQVFSLFGLKSVASENPHPWHLGIIHWVDKHESQVEVDGRFLGRVLSVCGIRLLTNDMRSKDFVQAILVAGDDLNQQTTLVLPRYHFKEHDMVILRIYDKETTLRLDKKLLSTDDIEQYQIVRLAS